MKRLTVFFIVLFATAALAATETTKDSGQDKPQEEVESAPVTGKDNREEIQRSGGWPHPFIPSEEIGADSVVTFPADI